MTPEEAQSFLEGLHQQRDIYQVIAQLIREQTRRLGHSDIDEVVRLGEAKDHEMGRIEAISRELEPHKKSWALAKEGLPTTLREEIETALDRLKDELGQILELESESQQKFEATFQGFQKELRKSDGLRKMNQAYGHPSANSAGTFDEKR